MDTCRSQGAGLALRLLGACSQNTTPASLSEKLVPRLPSEWEGGPSHLAMPQNHLRNLLKSGLSGSHTSRGDVTCFPKPLFWKELRSGQGIYCTGIYASPVRWGHPII